MASVPAALQSSPLPQNRRLKANDERWIRIVEEYEKLPKELRDDLGFTAQAVRDRAISTQKQTRIMRFVVGYLLSLGRTTEEIFYRLRIPRQNLSRIMRELRKGSATTTNREKQRLLMLLRIQEKERAIRRLRNRLERKGDGITRYDIMAINELIKTEVKDLEGTRRKLLGLDAPTQHEVKQQKVASIKLVVHGSREQLAPMLEHPNVIDVPSLPAPPPDEDSPFPEV